MDVRSFSRLLLPLRALGIFLRLRSVGPAQAWRFKGGTEEDDEVVRIVLLF